MKNKVEGRSFIPAPIFLSDLLTVSFRGVKSPFRGKGISGGVGIWTCLKMVSGDILGVGAPLAAPAQ